MRISDWSSDVCSSDLRCSSPLNGVTQGSRSSSDPSGRTPTVRPPTTGRRETTTGNRLFRARAPSSASTRSEEHTSELQSLMRISYAVFCLTNKHLEQYITQLLLSQTSTSRLHTSYIT